MRELTDVAEQLRTVRAAELRFLTLWAMEQAIVRPGLDRVAADLHEFEGCAGPISPELLRNASTPVDDSRA